MIREFIVVKTSMTMIDMYPTVFFDKEKTIVYNTRFNATEGGGVEISGNWTYEENFDAGDTYDVGGDDDEWKVLAFYPPTAIQKVEYAFREDTLKEQDYLDLIKLIHEPEDDEVEEEEEDVEEESNSAIKTAKSPFDMVAEDKKKKPWWQRL